MHIYARFARPALFLIYPSFLILVARAFVSGLFSVARALRFCSSLVLVARALVSSHIYALRKRVRCKRSVNSLLFLIETANPPYISMYTDFCTYIYGDME